QAPATTRAILYRRPPWPARRFRARASSEPSRSCRGRAAAADRRPHENQACRRRTAARPPTLAASLRRLRQLLLHFGEQRGKSVPLDDAPELGAVVAQKAHVIRDDIIHRPPAAAFVGQLVIDGGLGLASLALRFDDAVHRGLTIGDLLVL